MTTEKNFLSAYKTGSDVIIPLENPKLIDTKRLDSTKETIFKKSIHYGERAVLAMNTVIVGITLYNNSLFELDGLNYIEMGTLGLELLLIPAFIYRTIKFNGHFHLTKTHFTIKRRKNISTYTLNELQKVFKVGVDEHTHHIRFVYKDGRFAEEKWLFYNGKSAKVGDQLIGEINQRIQEYDTQKV